MLLNYWQIDSIELCSHAHYLCAISVMLLISSAYVTQHHAEVTGSVESELSQVL